MHLPLTRAARRRLGLLSFTLAIVLAATGAFAQVDERPSTDRPTLPTIEPEPPSPLSPAPSLEVPEPGAMDEPLSLRVEAFDFEGNTAFSTEELRAVLSVFVGRRADSTALLRARDAVTRHYVEAGYATSGALLPDQRVGDGRVKIRVVEGRLAAVEIDGNRRFTQRYFAERLTRAARTPLRVRAIEVVLQRFQQDPLIERVTARLEPTARLGESRLVLAIEEARQEDLKVGADNDRSPAVGDEEAVVEASVANLLGHRDTLAFTGGFTEGLVDVGARLAIPVTPWDTRLEARVRYSESKIVEFPFDPLDIESDSISVGLRLMQPVLRSRRQRLELGLGGDWRRGRSTLSGSLFCFQPGVTDCTPTTTVLRLFADWQWQDPNQAAAIRSTLSWGNGWLGATTRPGNQPDGRFVAWLAQTQYARRLGFGSTIVARFDAQLTDDPLLAYERIAVGGARTVRGYRPNQLVRDSGLVASLEWRIPVWARAFGAPYVEIAPFWDIGHAWNERFDPGDNTIASLGLGLVIRPHERIEARFDWGERLYGVERTGSGLIGQGIHFRVIVDAW